MFTLHNSGLETILFVLVDLSHVVLWSSSSLLLLWQVTFYKQGKIKVPFKLLIPQTVNNSYLTSQQGIYQILVKTVPLRWMGRGLPANIHPELKFITAQQECISEYISYPPQFAGTIFTSRSSEPSLFWPPSLPTQESNQYNLHGIESLRHTQKCVCDATNYIV